MQVEDLSCPVCEFSLRTFTKPKRERSGRRRNPANEGERTEVLALTVESEDGSSFYTTMTDLVIGSIEFCMGDDLIQMSDILNEIAKHTYFDSLSKRFVTPVIDRDLLAFILENDPVVSTLYYVMDERIHRKHLFE